MMNTIVKPTIILAIVAFIAALALSNIKKITAPHIERQVKQKKEQAIRMVLPGYALDSDADQKKITIDNSEFVYWVGTKTVEDKDTKQPQTVNGYAFIAVMPGYSGVIESMVGVDAKGEILGISILQQTETPGLGSRSMEVASKATFFGTILNKTVNDSTTTRPWFQEQFNGLRLDKKIEIQKKGDWTPEKKQALLEKNSISAITGATITTKTVRDSIVNGYEKLKKALDLHAKEKSK